MLRPDTQKFQLLELIGISGEFPADQLNRLFSSPSYAEKVITELKADKLIRTHYKDRLRGYRLTKRSKEMLLEYNPLRFRCYLTGNTETNRIRSEVFRRIRLHQKAQTYLTLSHTGIPFYQDEKPNLFSKNREAVSIDLQDLPYFYSSREVKELGDVTIKIKSSRSMGILMTPHCVYAVYNTGDGILKWEHKTEVRLNAFLQHHLQGLPYTGHPKIHAIMFGDSMDTAFKLLTSTGGYKRSLFMLDDSFTHFHFIPNDTRGETLLKLLIDPNMATALNRLLLSDQGSLQGEIPFEHDAVDPDGIPTLLAYDFDMQRICRFNNGMNVYGMAGNVICFDFQIPVLKKYMNGNVSFSSIDLTKFRRGFLHEP
ncbi:hypothetical protein C808_02518 [Lachnospiraceae bacterium M18-1]|nr:hypothetical protein C808_02518 [Lachnospiraceae bacterium M18-1]